MLPRLYCDAPLHPGQTLTLPPLAARHAQVLRLQPGMALRLFNGQGGEFEAVVSGMGRSSVDVSVGTHRLLEREAGVEVHLALGVPANERMDWLVEKATELGVASIQPLLTERSVLRLQGERADKRRLHWQAIASAACEQCGRNRVPVVHTLTTLQAWLAQDAASAPSTSLASFTSSTASTSSTSSTLPAPSAPTARPDSSTLPGAMPPAASAALHTPHAQRLPGPLQAPDPAHTGGAAGAAPARWLLSLAPQAQTLSGLRGAMGAMGAQVHLLSGPEGGLSPAEEAAACAQGYAPLSLGPRTLRAETAPLAALAALVALGSQG